MIELCWHKIIVKENVRVWHDSRWFRGHAKRIQVSHSQDLMLTRCWILNALKPANNKHGCKLCHLWQQFAKTPPTHPRAKWSQLLSLVANDATNRGLSRLMRYWHTNFSLGNAHNPRRRRWFSGLLFLDSKCWRLRQTVEQERPETRVACKDLQPFSSREFDTTFWRCLDYRDIVKLSQDHFLLLIQISISFK